MGEVTIEQLECYGATSTVARIQWATMRWHSGAPPCYAEFVDVVETAVAQICNELARDPQMHYGQKEDHITYGLVGRLKVFGFHAAFDTTVGGHCDVVVKWNDDLIWLAEAKHYTSNSWLWKGYQQLSSRYSTGEPRGSRGGMLIYCSKPRTDLLMESWKGYMLDQCSDFVFEPKPDRLANAFSSHAVSNRTGVAEVVTHFPVSIYFEPLDRPKKPRKKASKKAIR